MVVMISYCWNANNTSIDAQKRLSARATDSSIDNSLDDVACLAPRHSRRVFPTHLAVHPTSSVSWLPLN